MQAEAFETLLAWLADVHVKDVRVASRRHGPHTRSLSSLNP